jgi:carbonic anhydrase/acetyltransferase-like protein (isoleucine patch superfamily)
MILDHLGKAPQIHPDAYVAPTATVCGDVRVAAGARIMFGACVVAEGKPIEIGVDTIVMENAVVRSTSEHPASIGASCLIGPQAHVVGCTLADCVFIATGAAIFHGARLGHNVEVRVHAVVHLRTELPAHTTVPIGWVAVGAPAVILPPDQHDAIWKVQRPLDFPGYVYGVERAPEGQSHMPEVTRRRSQALGRHAGDQIVRGGSGEG